ncbi:MAG: ATP-binding protein, partial [candidate division NC10 bacterium]
LSPPRLILVMGIAGSGKSVLARAILEQVWAVYLDNNFLADAFSPASRTDERYLAVRENLYAALYRITEENLRIGNTVLLDAPHIRQVQDAEWCRWIQGLAKDAGAWMRAIRCLCSERLLRERLEARGENRDRWKLENWQAFLEQQPPRVPIPFSHLELDTAEPLRANVARAVSYILKDTKDKEGHSL